MNCRHYIRAEIPGLRAWITLSKLSKSPVILDLTHTRTLKVHLNVQQEDDRSLFVYLSVPGESEESSEACLDITFAPPPKGMPAAVYREIPGYKEDLFVAESLLPGHTYRINVVDIRLKKLLQIADVLLKDEAAPVQIIDVQIPAPEKAKDEY